MKNANDKNWFYGLYLLLLGGIVLRLLVFFQNRSLFIDEASLALNIVQRGFGGLFQELEQAYAPPFYSVITRCFTLLFGNTEFALRAFPLLCGLASLLVFYKLVLRFCSDIRLAWYPLFLLAFSFSFVQYATEVKQYSSDIFTALSLLYLATDKRFLFFETATNQSYLFVFWSLVGMLSVWLSMSSIFFLAAIGTAFFIQSIRQKNRFLIPTLLIGGTWLLSFGCYYGLILSGDIGDDSLKDYHAPFFFPLLPTSMADVQQAWVLIRQFFGSTFGTTAVAIAWGMISVAVGVGILWHKNKRLLWFLCVPIFLVLVASSIHYYSLIKRLTLFFLPNLMLLSMFGTVFLFQKANAYWKVLVLAVLGLICFNQKGYPYFVQKLEIEELRPLLYAIKTDWSPADITYIHPEAVPAFDFYTAHFRAKRDYNFLQNASILRGNWQYREQILLDYLSKNKLETIGLLFSHATEAEVQRVIHLFKNEYAILLEKRTTGASYFALKRKKIN